MRHLLNLSSMTSINIQSRSSIFEKKILESIRFYCDDISYEEAQIVALGLIELASESNSINHAAIISTIEDYAPSHLPDDDVLRKDFGLDILRCMGIIHRDKSLQTENTVESAEKGYCVMCERIMPPTQHHLVPRTTWKKLKKHIPDQWNMSDADDSTLDSFMRRTINICRPCHSCIHRVHDEFTLAKNYYTLNLLMDDPDVRKFTDWASRQKEKGANSYFLKNMR